MIGEDGRMTDDAGERYAGLSPAEARRAGGRGPRRPGPAARRASPTPTRSRSRTAPARASSRCVSLQWFCDMSPPGGAGDRGGRGGPGAVHARPSGARVYLDWMREIRHWCISRQLWWGHQIPVWYRGEETTSAARPRRARAGSATPTCSTPGSARRSGPSPPWAGPSGRPSSSASTRPSVLSTARDIIFLWVARMVMMGCEFMGDEPFARRRTSTRWSRRPTAGA